MNLEIGKQIGHYKILSKIGKGGMGEVYLAQDTKLNRQVAIKFLNSEFSQDVDKLHRFIQEAQSASALNHPNIITIYEIGEFDNVRYMAAEYIEGESLDEHLKSKRLKLGSVLDTAIQIASALDEAHQAGIVHRDIKPDNIMIRKNGLVKILDFGIAKLTEKPKPEIESEDATAIQVNTSPGMIIGTANYMSPEQAKGKEVDARTDIFSFGVVFYEMLAGKLPFSGETPMEMISSIIKDEPKPLNNSEIPPEIERIISKALRKNRDDRYQTIKGLLADLKEVKQELEFQDKLERTIQPDKEERKTQILKATTIDERQQSTINENLNDSILIKKSNVSKLAIGAVAILLIAAIGLGYWYLSRNGGGDRIDSIAVMPFVNAENYKDADYLADGLAESIIYDLSKIPDLKVLPTSTVFTYKGKETDPQTVGSELGVRAVLVSRISQSGDNLSISTELIDTQQNNVIWGERYTRKLSDALTIQKEISKEISENLRLNLSSEKEKKLTETQTENAEAYQAYLKGRFYWNKRTEEGIRKGIEYFNQAIELDPNYALAWSGLADSYLVLGQYSYGSKSKDFVEKASAAAEKAIELDPNLAEARTSLALLKVYNWEFEEAERLFKKSLEINPNYATTRHWHATLLDIQGKYDEALRERIRTIELDPLNKLHYGNLGNLYLNIGKYEKVVETINKGIELDPNFFFFYQVLGEYYEKMGAEKKAFENYQKNYRLSGREKIAAIAEEAYREHEFKAYKRTVAEEELKNNNLSYTERASFNAQLGNREKAFENLQKAYEERESYLIGLKYFAFDDLRDDPRFKELVRKIGLPE